MANTEKAPISSIKDLIQQLSDLASAAQVSQKKYTWTWSEGVDFDGSRLDFVIPGAEENEIGGLDGCILFVGGSLQTDTFSLEFTNVAQDTVRIEGQAGDREGTVEVALYYLRTGVSLGNSFSEAPIDGGIYARQNGAWVEIFGDIDGGDSASTGTGGIDGGDSVGN
jgi:hypothetical protein